MEWGWREHSTEKEGGGGSGEGGGGCLSYETDGVGSWSMMGWCWTGSMCCSG